MCGLNHDNIFTYNSVNGQIQYLIGTLKAARWTATTASLLPTDDN